VTSRAAQAGLRLCRTTRFPSGSATTIIQHTGVSVAGNTTGTPASLIFFSAAGKSSTSNAAAAPTGEGG